MRWQPAEPAWAGLLLVHGLGEHAGRYDHVGQQMAAAGIEVHAYDHRGFGASSGPRAYVDRWSRLPRRPRGTAAARAGDKRRPPRRPVRPLDGRADRRSATSWRTIPRPLPDLLVLSCPGLDSTIAGWKQARARARHGSRRGSASRTASGPAKPVARSGRWTSGSPSIRSPCGAPPPGWAPRPSPSRLASAVCSPAVHRYPCRPTSCTAATTRSCRSAPRSRWPEPTERDPTCLPRPAARDAQRARGGGGRGRHDRLDPGDRPQSSLTASVRSWSR